MVETLSPQSVALRVMAETRLKRTLILIGFAEREMDIVAVLLVDRAAHQHALHRGDIRLIEPHGLEVRQTPPGFAEGRVNLDRAPECRYPFLRSSDRF